MPVNATTERSSNPAGITAVGIDVGGERKGFHAVAITDGSYSGNLSTKDMQELARWCRVTMRAQVIAIDAPCHWSPNGRARPAEREMMKNGIWCFSTPTKKQALGHPTNYFGWMLQGARMYQRLKKSHPLVVKLPIPRGKNCSLETFPHGITCSLWGDKAKARQKRRQRRELLERVGIDIAELTNIDLVDAALCAYTAYHAVRGGECIAYGDANTGLIIVPKGRLS